MNSLRTIRAGKMAYGRNNVKLFGIGEASILSGPDGSLRTRSVGVHSALSAFIGVHRRLTFFRYVRTDMNPGKRATQPPMNADERR